MLYEIWHRGSDVIVIHGERVYPFMCELPKEEEELFTTVRNLHHGLTNYGYVSDENFRDSHKLYMVIAWDEG